MVAVMASPTAWGRFCLTQMSVICAILRPVGATFSSGLLSVGDWALSDFAGEAEPVFTGPASSLANELDKQTVARSATTVMCRCSD